METKIGYIIAAYFGKRATYHSRYIDDKMFYINIQLEQISKLNTKLERIYIVCTFDDLIDKDIILSDLYQLKDTHDNIIIITRENLGGSYCSWRDALHIDNGFCDYIILEEDDYTFAIPDSITHLLEYFSEEPDLFYVCQWWHQNHAAAAGGMLNNKLYHKLRDAGLDFQVKYEKTEYMWHVMWENQISFLEPYKSEGYNIRDMSDKYRLQCPQSQGPEKIYGKSDGVEIYIPIINKYF